MAAMMIPGVTEAEIQQIKNGEIELGLDDRLYNLLYDFFIAIGEMPYDVVKARTQDPVEWICNKIADEC